MILYGGIIKKTVPELQDTEFFVYYKDLCYNLVQKKSLFIAKADTNNISSLSCNLPCAKAFF